MIQARSGMIILQTEVMASARVLYISYDGMTDPLGASQVLPYVEGLAQKGHQITLLSCEKTVAFYEGKDRVRARCKKHGIRWMPVPYHKNPPVLSTIKDVKRMRREASIMHLKEPFDFVHCRSYIAALVGLYLKRTQKLPFIFDMRGFWADERIDGGLWSKKHPLFGRVYRFFKKKEREFFTQAAHTVSLTENGKEEFMSWGLDIHPEDVSIIPTCADAAHFSPDNVDEEKRAAYKEELEIKDGHFVLSYLGSVGTWYLPDEMMQFFKELKKKWPDAIFLWITKDYPQTIHELAKKNGVNVRDIRVKGANRDDLPSLMALSDLSVFFIKTRYSKKASSPTKLAELLSMGIPVVCNGGVGDLHLHISLEHGGYLINEFTADAYADAVAHIPRLMETSLEAKQAVVKAHYLLENGVESYDQIYQKVLQQAQKERAEKAKK